LTVLHAVFVAFLSLFSACVPSIATSETDRSPNLQELQQDLKLAAAGTVSGDGAGLPSYLRHIDKTNPATQIKSNAVTTKSQLNQSANALRVLRGNLSSLLNRFIDATHANFCTIHDSRVLVPPLWAE
jgi:hypothetical protein